MNKKTKKVIVNNVNIFVQTETQEQWAERTSKKMASEIMRILGFR